jgi:hypothetical protein
MDLFSGLRHFEVDVFYLSTEIRANKSQRLNAKLRHSCSELIKLVGSYSEPDFKTGDVTLNDSATGEFCFCSKKIADWITTGNSGSWRNLTQVRYLNLSVTQKRCMTQFVQTRSIEYYTSCSSVLRQEDSWTYLASIRWCGFFLSRLRYSWESSRH